MNDFGRKTETMGEYSGRTTQLMGGSDLSRKTEIMDGAGIRAIAASLSVGAEIDSYKVVSVIAENTGEATLLLAEKENINYVLKIYHQNKRPKEELKDTIRKIQSEYVICPVDEGEYAGRFYEVMPYFKNGDILANMPIDETVLEELIIPCVNQGLKDLHDNDIIHRDIKPGNIFFNDAMDKTVIGDFGISSVLKGDMSVRATGMSRTLGYAAPEASSGFISKESDYYSFGITLWHLILGQDPFLGMNDMQILYQTINKRIELPQMTPPRLCGLIHGLTAKDRNARWGYNEVLKWLANEQLEEPSNTDSFGMFSEYSDINTPKKGYMFENVIYNDLKSLGSAVAKNWESAKKELYRGNIEKGIMSIDDFIAVKCGQLMNVRNVDFAVFQLIYLLNPDSPLCYKGEVYNTVEHLGEKMFSEGNKIDKNIEEMLLNGCMVFYLDLKGFDKSLINAVKFIAERIRADEYEYYYALKYLFTDHGYTLNQKEYTSIEDLCEALNKEDFTQREIYASKLISDRDFLMWVFSLGYEKQIIEWKKQVEKAEWL